MASPIRKANLSVNRRLANEPHKFSFYQAVRLLIQCSTTTVEPAPSEGPRRTKIRRGRIGTVSNVSDEPVRFRTQAALNFAPSEIISITTPEERNKADSTKAAAPDQRSAVDMEVSFWGLTGPAGALPNHYTQTVIDRAHAKDHAMKDFFDLFSHRQLSFFYRAWEKYFLPAGFESSLQNGDARADLIRETLMSLVGRGTDHVRDRLEASDDALVYYGGIFTDRPTAESLRAMVGDYLRLPTQVISLFGQWLVLPPAERSRLGALDGHCRMGMDTILGDRMWDPSSKFRIQLGPVNWTQFDSLMPTGESLVRICQFIRSYVGMQFDFDLQVILMASEIPMCKLASGQTNDDSLPTGDGSTEHVRPHLGWNTWLCSQPPTQDSHEAVFSHDGSPTR